MTVYLVRAGSHGPVKIGVARDVARRLVSLQTNCAEELHVIALYAGGPVIERALHRHFADAAIRGEWFRYRPDMADGSLEHLGYEREALVPLARRTKVGGTALHRWVIGRGMTMAEFGRAVGISLAQVSKLCRGKHSASGKTVRAIYSFTGGEITPNDLFDLPPAAPKEAAE